MSRKTKIKANLKTVPDTFSLDGSYFTTGGFAKEYAARKGGVEKLHTGIPGLDEALEGGIPKNGATLISGPSGTGKTVFLSSFIYNGITKFGENGVYVTFGERPKDIIKNVKNFNWDYNPFIKDKKLAFMDESPLIGQTIEITADYDFMPLVKRIEYAVKKVKAKRIVLDGIDALFARFTNKEAVRSVLYQIVDNLKSMRLTAVIATEKVGEAGIARYGVEEFVADAVIELDAVKGQQQFIRKMYVRKIRGTGFRSGMIEFDITKGGLEVYPKIPIERTISKTDFKIRKKFGIKVLDELLGGGIPQGHMVLISGNTGTGKTIFGMQFAVCGIKHGENVLFVNMEEPREQIEKTALVYGWDFVKYEKQGRLGFVVTNLIDISNDKMLYAIVNAANRLNAKRIVFDSLSTLFSTTMNDEQTRQFFMQLGSFCKAQGITCIMNYINSANFGAVRGQLLSTVLTNEIRFSSFVDGIIVLLYVERGQRVKKLLNILKMRGSQHSKEVYLFDIEKGGIVMGEKYEE
ncbi:MAG: AAA family ATPase [Sedimentisphaerales bacterium]|nr:AAA family ATPase [Sedimentisphaerales bacterium]